MARPKNKIRKVRVRLDGFLEPGVDDDILNMLAALPPRTKFPTVIRMLRMGKALSAVTQETPDDEVLRLVREAEQAADEFFDRFDDDE